MTAVPALQRGLHLLEVLNQHENLSLEQISGYTQFPKASILRMLETLAEMGLVRKQEGSKHYAALGQIKQHKQTLSQLVMHALQGLANESDVCVEWYEIGNEGMRITQRFSAPENEVLVFARQGFIRPWQGELEAVIAVARCFTDTAEEHDSTQAWNYDADGEKIALNEEQCADIFAKVRQDAYYCDPRFNSNGVRRMAAPVLIDGACKGVVALSLSFTPQLRKTLVNKKENLLACVHNIQKQMQH